MLRMPRKIWPTRLKVAQYAAWRARFDGMRDSRASAGIANAKLFRGDEETVVVLADIPGFRDALAWAEGRWRTAIPVDEVEGPPVVYFGTGPGQEAPGGSGIRCVTGAPEGHGTFQGLRLCQVA